MPIRLFLATLFMLPGLSMASLSVLQLQEIRNQAFVVCNNLLVYYNPNQDSYDPRNAERYRQGMQQLQRLIVEEPDPQLAEAVITMHAQISQLERHPPSDARLYPNWINPLLQAQAHLDQRAATLYAALPEQVPQRQILHRLSLNIDRLLLLYETRTFGSLAVYVVDMEEHTFDQLDEQIIQGFAGLTEQWPQQATELDRLKRMYDFVRPRLLRHELGWVPASAAYYLGQITDSLTRLDTQTAPSTARPAS